MSLSSGFWKEMTKLEEEEKKKKPKRTTTTTTKNTGTSQTTKRSSGSMTSSFWNALDAEDIAPVSRSVSDRITVSTPKKEEKDSIFDGWFKKSESGIAKSILGTGTDLLSDLGTGIVGMGEKAIDAFANIAPYSLLNQNEFGYLDPNLAKKQQEIYQKATKESDEFVKKDLYDEEKVSKKILAGLGSASYLGNISQNGGQVTAEDLALSREMTKGAQKYLDEEMEKDSVLDEKSDSLVQSAGQLLGTSALAAMGIPADVVIGLTSYGGEVENALNQGASHEEAGLSAAVSAGAEILTEKISGGIKFGGKTLDDAATKWLGRHISNKIGRTLAKMGMDMVGEGAEEVLSGIMSAVGQQMTYMEEKELKELFTSEDAWESFIGGAALGAGGSAIQTVNSAVNGRDAVTDLTANEQKVVDKIYKDELAKKKLTEKQKAKLYDEILEDMEKGYISTDTIEEALGGEKYEQYKKAKDWEDSLQKEFDELGNKQNATLAEQRRYAELDSQLRNVKATSNLGQMKAQLNKDVYELTKGDRLVESYFENVRSKQKYEADLTKYEGKARDIIKQVMDSGLADNSNQTHEFWDMAAKMSADRDTTISIATQDEILKMVKEEYEAEGKTFDASKFKGVTIDGYASKNGIVLNAQTKRALNFVVGHEITHTLEQSNQYKDLQKILFDYAKDEYKTRYQKRAGQYENIYSEDGYKEKIDKEVAADMVGDILFSDKDFVKHLSTQNRNVFQKMWDEVKYLCKVATAGSKEARQLEKVKKAFEDAYREAGKEQGESKFSVSETDKTYTDAVMSGDMETAQRLLDETAKSAGYNIKAYHGTRSGEFFVFDKNRIGDNYSGYNAAGGGFDFSTDEDRAFRWGDMARGLDPIRTIPVYLKAEKTFYNYENVPKDLESTLPDGITEAERAEAMSAGYAYRKVLEKYGIDFKRAITSKGYDSYSMYQGYENIAVYEPSQIKSAELVTTDPETGEIISLSKRFNTENPDIRFSVSEEQNQKGLDSQREVEFSISYDTDYSDAAIKLNESQKKVDPAVMKAAKDLRGYVAKRLTEMVDKGVALPPDEIGQTWHKDESYGGSMENTLVCPRSLAPEAFMDAVSKNVGRPLTVKEQIYVGQELMTMMTTNEELRNQSFMAQCVYCYVAADRMAQREFLGEYIKQRDAVLEKVANNPNIDVSQLEADHNALAKWWENKKSKKPELSEVGKLYQEFLKKRKPTGATYERFRMWVENYTTGSPMIDGNHLASIEEIAGDLKNFDAALVPQIRDAWKYAQSASWAKKRTSYVAYNGQILKWDSDVVDALNEHYGMRMYSFSDYHPAFVLENMQMITDAAVRGLKTLAYTKDLDFAEIFAPTHANINISTFGFEKNGQVYEDNQMGAEWAKAKALREQYPNVGITFVATNDTITEWAMKQDWIDVVIPYHMVKTGKIIAEHFGYKNYTRESSDKKTAKWRKDKTWKEDHVSSIAPTMHDNNLETYLAALDANGLKPRFERFLKNPETRPYYMKLVNECRLPASQSQAVQPKFNEDAIERTLARLAVEGYYTPIGGSVDRMLEIAAGVAEGMPELSISNEGETHNEYGRWNVYSKYTAPVASVSEMESVAPETNNPADVAYNPADVAYNPADADSLFPDDLSPVQEELERLEAERDQIYSGMEIALETGSAAEVGQLAEEYDAITARIRELESGENQRADSLTDNDAPPEMEAPLSMRSENYDPFAGIGLHDISRSTRSYSDQNPGARHFFEEGALGFLYDVNNSTHGERWYNDQLYYDSGGEKGFGGTSRVTTDDIADLKDTYGYTWDELRKAAQRVADGDFRSVAAKRVEYLVHKRMMEGYTDVDGRPIPANQEYISYLNETFANEQRQGGVFNLLQNAGQYDPEGVAPLKPTETALGSKEVKGQQTYITTEDKLKGRRVESGVADAPLYDSKDKTAVKGQQTMFEPPKPNPKVAAVLTEESAIEKEKSGIGMKLASALVDKGMVFENLSLKEGNHELQAKWNYALPSNTEARAQYFMEKGANGVKPLKDIKKAVDDSGKADDFYNYLYHVHNIDRMSLEDRFDNVPNKTVFGETVTADVSRKKVAQFEKNNPEFKDWAEDVYAYNKHLRQLLVDGDVISQETADLWEKMYPHYVPIRRVDTHGQNISVPLDSRKTGVNNPVKRAIGGSSDIMPLFETMAMRTEQTYRAIARNSFGVELLNTLGSEAIRQKPSVDEMIETIGAQEDLLKQGTTNSNPTFTVFENGERVEFEITEDMFDALKPAGKLLGHRSKAIGAIGDARRNLLTVWNPVFALYRNPIKDIQDVAVNSQHAAKTYMNIPNAIFQMATDGKYAMEYHQNGGKSNTYFDSRSNQFAKEDNIFKKTIGLPVRAIETAGEFVEEIPRLAEYIASRQEGRSVERSMLDASRVTTNFAAGGDFTKFLNSHGFTFLNASVQGLSQHVRNIREAKQEGLKGYVKVLAKYTVAGLPTVLLNSMLWDDDEEYEELSDYVKQNYYVVAKTEDGKFVRIPKGRTAAVMGELFEQMQNLVTGDDEADFSTFFELFMNNIAPNNPIENNILAPIGQVMKNEAWYGGDLVPSRLQSLPNAEQFDESTDSISKWLGEKTNTSPYKWNYLIDQYSGGLGDVFLPMLTPEAESGDNSLMGNFFAPWKKELTTDMVLNNKNPGDFYDLKDELEKLSNSRNATEEDSMRSMYMDSVSWEMGDLYAQKREIQSGDLPDNEKYEAVREIQEKINALAKNAMEGYNNVSIDGLYSEVGDKRYNKDAESGKWYEIREKNSDGTANYYYKQEQKVTKAFGISPAEYWNNREEYNYAYDKPEQYALSQAVGGYQSYRSYTSELWDIKADKDKNGKSISGSRKEKVIDWLNEQDMDYYHKIILFKSEYNADDTYNMEIIDYLNGREDISYKQMETILKYLGFEVDSRGNISWD